MLTKLQPRDDISQKGHKAVGKIQDPRQTSAQSLSRLLTWNLCTPYVRMLDHISPKIAGTVINKSISLVHHSRSKSGRHSTQKNTKSSPALSSTLDLSIIARRNRLHDSQPWPTLSVGLPTLFRTCRNIPKSIGRSNRIDSSAPDNHLDR